MSATGSSLRQPETGRSEHEEQEVVHRLLVSSLSPSDSFPPHLPRLLPPSSPPSYLSRFHSFTDPSVAQEAKLTSDWSREIPDSGRKTTAPTLVWCPSANQRAVTWRRGGVSYSRHTNELILKKYVLTHTHIYTHINIYIYVFIHTYKYYIIYTYIYTYVCINICIYTYVYIIILCYINVCVCIYIYIYLFICVHVKDIYTHIHTF